MSRPTPTKRQQKALEAHVARASRRYGITVPPWRDGYPWATSWADETRPGRGHDLSTIYSDGDHILVIQLDVYGYGHGMSIGDIDWVHSDGNEDCPCDWCRDKREAA